MKISSISLKNVSLLSLPILMAFNTLSIGAAKAFSLANPSFEANSVTNLPSTTPNDPNFESAPPPRPNPGFVITAEINVSGWTSTDVGIELWQSGFSGGAGTPVTAAPGNGTQFAEVNATANLGIFQDISLGSAIATTPLFFNFWHRARERGDNPLSNNNQINAITLTITDSVDGDFTNGNVVLFTGVFATQLTIGDFGTNNGWVNYSSLSTALNIPITLGIGAPRAVRYGFVATQLSGQNANYFGTTGGSGQNIALNQTVSTTNSLISFGNFLDNADFGNDPTFSSPIPFDFDANVGIGILGALYFGRKAFKSWKNKKDNSN